MPSEAILRLAEAPTLPPQVSADTEENRLFALEVARLAGCDERCSLICGYSREHIAHCLHHTMTFQSKGELLFERQNAEAVAAWVRRQHEAYLDWNRADDSEEKGST